MVALASVRGESSDKLRPASREAGPFFTFDTIEYMKYLIGVDEAGRGPLAGPVAVGAVMVARDFDWTLVAEAKDSKQMTPKSREILYSTMTTLRENGKLDFAVAFSSSSMIDTYGIVPAIKSALARCLDKLSKGRSPWTDGCEILLDGGLRAS